MTACPVLLLLLLGLAAPSRGAYLRGGLHRPAAGASRSTLLRMMPGASDRMASHGLLYEGWGAEGLKSLNKSHDLLQTAEDEGINRYDLARIVADKAKEIAYAHCEDDDMGFNPMLSGGTQARKAKNWQSEVIRAIADIQTGMEANPDTLQRLELEDTGDPEAVAKYNAAVSEIQKRG